MVEERFHLVKQDVQRYVNSMQVGSRSALR